MALYDQWGALLVNQPGDFFAGHNELQVDLKPYPPGVYFLCIYTDNLSQSVRLVKI
ncbi:MAG: T9SS type A sorting domain-containing protein [Saprospiraceae bacterium]|nr:T9SS type A sorting domain-containing protein [Saprospiraceae bacterium]